MIREIEKVQAFHKKFNAQINIKPTMISLEEGMLRYELMKEELEEYRDAIIAQDLVGVLDALTDMSYINCGSYVAHGLQEVAEAAFQEVQNSNMSKLDKDGNPVINGQNGILDERKALGKILKGENFFEPNLKQFLVVKEEVNIEGFYPIKRGDSFICTKDFIMDDGEVSYTEGKMYISEENNCVTNNKGNSSHMHSEDGDLYEHMNKIK